MKNKKTLTLVTYAALASLLYTNQAFAMGISSLIPNWSKGYGSDYPTLPTIETFSHRENYAALNISQNDLYTTTLAGTDINYKNYKDSRLLRNFISNPEGPYGDVFGTMAIEVSAIQASNSNDGATWEIKIYNKDDGPAFKGNSWFKSELANANDPNIYAPRFWDIRVPAQYRIVMQVDGKEAPVNLKNYGFQEKAAANKQVSFKEAKDIASSAEQLGRNSMRKVKNYSNAITNKGEVNLNIDTYDGGWNQSPQSMVVSNLTFTKFNHPKNGLVNLVDKGALSFMGDPALSYGMYVRNTTNVLKTADQVPDLMYQYSPSQTIRYSVNQSSGSKSKTNIVMLEVSASYWTSNIQYYPGPSFQPTKSKLETKKIRLALELPNDLSKVPNVSWGPTWLARPSIHRQTDC